MKKRNDWSKKETEETGRKGKPEVVLKSSAHRCPLVISSSDSSRPGHHTCAIAFDLCFAFFTFLLS